MKKIGLALLSLLALPASAFAHHLDDYDARIRAEARLPEDWFTCKDKDDCTVVEVPCQWDLAVSARHADAARDALIDAFPFCLGTALHDTAATCQHSRCTTEPAAP